VDPLSGGAARARALGPYTAAGLVFFASAGVLVVEIVALRLLAPYFGLTLETSTMVIAIALAAIASGSWTGGRLADQVPPLGLVGPLLAVSGAVVALTPALVRATAASGSTLLVTVVAALMIFIPGALLAAVTPLVTKLSLHSLEHTGTVVGRLSGISTAGSIAGTVVTGFVLISRVPVSGIMIGLGLALVAVAVVLMGLSRRRVVVLPVAALVLSGAVVATVPSGCDLETAYHCADVRSDPARSSGRTLVLDGASHSYVDLDDPTHLEYDYVRGVVATVDSAFPPGAALRAHHLGGGGLTVPHYLAATRPGTRSTVSEIDPGVLRLDRELLGLGPEDGIELTVEDARLGLGRRGSASLDLVVGDAFGGVSVPWHLTTRETVAEIERVLDDDGVYVLNVIDSGSLDFARAEAATLAGVFEHVAVASEPAVVDRTNGQRGANVVLAASNRPLDGEAVAARLQQLGTTWSVVTGERASGWWGDAVTLTDDYAPVDQLLDPYGV
jgi:spermidine synthase